MKIMKVMKIIAILIIGMLSFGALLAQTPAWEGVWVLDSVQVKEIMPDSIVEKTVLPGERALLDANWMNRFKLDTDGKASYTEVAIGTLPVDRPYFFTDIPYEIMDVAGNTATLVIDGVPDNKILNMQWLSDSSMVISHSFTKRMTIYLHDVEIAWKMYYRRITE